MDPRTLDELRARAVAAASDYGAGAEVQLRDLAGSEVQVGGARVVLTVFRVVDRRPRSLMQDYRPERENLAEVIESDAREMAERLSTE
jgi:hypothetical protein